MLSRSNLFFLSLFLLCVSGCGFRPVYTPDSIDPSSSKKQNAAVAQDLSLIKINLISGRNGQVLRNNLIHSLTPKGQPGNPRYILSIILKEDSQALGILKDATFSRSQLTFTADFSLVDTSTHKLLLTAQAVSTSNFNFITSNQFATIVADDDAHMRGLVILAQDITRQLAMYFSSSRK